MTIIIFINDDNQIASCLRVLALPGMQTIKQIHKMFSRTSGITGVLLLTLLTYTACVDKTPSAKEKLDYNELTKNQKEDHGQLVTAGELSITNPLNTAWVTEGKSIYEVKCQACHKLNSERLVGPGWSGLTKKRNPEWIINMITNVEVMLEKDPAAQRLLEECLVRMPNQNLNKEQARMVLEFQRFNDGEK
jgi:hypothetical protein